MNIPPFLEKLLLSNEAVFKNASLGLSGQNFLVVPKGKTAVILEINIQPFCNFVAEDSLKLWRDGYTDFDQIWKQIIARKFFQLQIINDLYNSYYSFVNDFAVVPSTNEPNSAGVELKFNGFKEDVFIYTDRGLYFNFIYPYSINDKDSTLISTAYGIPNGNFLPTEQNLPATPITFYKDNFINWVAGVLTNGFTETYSPTNRNTASPFLLPLKEYFRLFAQNAPNDQSNLTSIAQPIPTGDTYKHWDIFTQPLLNIKYALLNKRPSDYGLTFPGK